MSIKTIFFLLIVLTGTRAYYAKWDTLTVTNTLTWDAFGYYLYLPAAFIYHDIKKNEWVPAIQAKYAPTGNLYQLHKLPNGHFVGKYFVGLSILCLPFFLSGHLLAALFDFPQDGFSAPYQLSICLAALVYAFLGLWILRRILLKYFSDSVTALTLLLIVLATNYIQYVSIDSGMTHGFLFFLYILLLYSIMRWHEKPSRTRAFFIGFLVGFGILIRPTEAVMLFLPLFYMTHNRISSREKWALVRQNKNHLWIAILAGMLALMPQFLYWKTVTGQWIYDVGSKWSFLLPHWQVLIGWEKGWIFYTPLSIAMIIGVFQLYRNRHQEYNTFKLLYWSKAIILYFFINLWIVTAWDDWHYGASYSARALVQSYAVLSIPLAYQISSIFIKKWKWVISTVSAFLIFLNLFQVWQYNKGILHYRDMNFSYYKSIFLDPAPTPLDMSLLDTDDIIRDETRYVRIDSFSSDTSLLIHAVKNPKAHIFYFNKLHAIFTGENRWVHISAEVLSAWGAFDTNLTTHLHSGGKIQKEVSCRMQNGISNPGQWNLVEYYFSIPAGSAEELSVFAETASVQDIYIRYPKITFLQRR
jgi:hypothetical protein